MAVVGREKLIPLNPSPAEVPGIHSMLVKRGLRWLDARCAFAFSELATMAGETPDGWGWSSDGSILLEAKASRSDFMKDRKKFFRRQPGLGMGNLRYFVCLPELIYPDEVPAFWGLLYVYPKKVRVEVKAAWQVCNLKAERYFLCSALRRCAIRWPIKDICSIDTMPGKLSQKA